MSKKKLLEFGLKEADAFQKNFKIIFDRLVTGYKSMMGKDPEGLDLLKVKMEAREKAINTTKVVNQKGLTLDPDKPIVGGTQEGIETIKIKELDDFNLSKDDPMGDFEKIVKGEGDTGLPKKRFPRDVIDEEGIPDTMTQKDYDEGGIKSQMEDMFGVKLYGDETFDELMIIKNTGKHPRDMADGGRVAFRGGGMDASSDDFGGGGNTASDTGPGGGATDTGPSHTGDSIGGPSAPQDLGFIGSGPTVNPNLGKKGPNIISAPDNDPRFKGYTPSTFNPGGKNIFQKGFDLVKRAVTNPFTRNLGLAALGPLGYGKIANQIRTGLMAKGLLDSLGPMTDATIEDELEAITTGTDVTGQTTALYKDGGLVTLFTEKR